MNETGVQAPVEERFGRHSTSVHVWPEGIEGSNGSPFGILTATELYSVAAQQAIRMEAEARSLPVAVVLTEWEAEQDAATTWVTSRGLVVQWDSPAPLPEHAEGVCLRAFFLSPSDASKGEQS
ncbi:hypothetical protein [Terrabacter sp. NPDC080008]|uniref:hypothetical protein n=1 Tax=Terrabacter sp. NPDC080008 TaxID=3155176 RepID=UPI00344CB242